MGSSALTYVQIQQPMYPGFPSQSEGTLMFSVMLRNPLDQSLSHYMHAKTREMNFREWVELGLCRLRHGEDDAAACLTNYTDGLRARGVEEERVEKEREAIRSTSGYFLLFEDNIQVRWISGAVQGTVFDPMRRPGGMLTRKNFDTAWQKLNDYTAVFILERYNDREYGRLVRLLGWSEGVSPVAKVGTLRGSNAASELCEADLAQLRGILRWDIDLYRSAETLAARQA